MNKRPKIIKDKHLRFLDYLRESSEVNMYGARPYLIEMFEVTKAQATEILTYWMESFGKETR